MLTKAFVVLVTVLAILLVALTVSSVAQYENLSEEMTALQSSRDQARRTADLRQSQLDDLARASNEREARLEAQIEELTGRTTSLASQLAEARASTSDAERRLMQWEASLERLSTTDTVKAALLSSLTEELERRREESVRMQTRLVESASRIAELSTQSDSLERQVRRFRERMQALTEANRELEESIARMPPEVRQMISGTDRADRGPAPSQPIAGSIVQLDRQGQDLFAQINVGSNDGVAERMEFMVHRGDRYLGQLVIDSVEDDVAVGHLRLLQDDVQRGDAIFAGGL